MAQIVRTSVTANNATSSNILIRPQTDVMIGLQIALESGAMTCKVQYTMSPLGTAAEIVAAVWLDHPYLTAQTANCAGNIIAPVTAVRLVNASVGVARLTAMQMV